MLMQFFIKKPHGIKSNNGFSTCNNMVVVTKNRTKIELEREVNISYQKITLMYVLW